MGEMSLHALGIIAIFLVGYVFIILEHLTKINKTPIAILMAVLAWTLLFTDATCPLAGSLLCLGKHIADVSQLIFFLLGALTIIEIVNIHRGFNVVADWIRVTSKRKLLWTTAWMAFFLSSVLDNLTTTLVMVTLLRQLIDDRETRWILGGAVVIAANAGGAWTPIGDVTTTMLWIGGQLSTGGILTSLFLPSVVCLAVSLLVLTPLLEGNFVRSKAQEQHFVSPLSKTIFYFGVGALIFVPFFKAITGLPPFMGMLFGVSAIWIFTDVMHKGHGDREHLKVPCALSKVDLSSTLFFLGILLCVNALDTAHILEKLAHWLNQAVHNDTLIATLLGLFSAVIDNVPLVAASMGMYDLSIYIQDASFWKLIAYCAGTGGSILMIGSAAGVIYAGMEEISFNWYVKRMSLPALCGYFSGIIVYLLI